MKKMSVIFLLSCLMIMSSQAQTIYLVRHAEKANDGTKDPMLTTAGLQRAQNLAHMLSAAEIKNVYATDYQRTQLTAKPLADMLGISVKSYDPRQLSMFVDSLKQLEGNVLVVGHSNTTPQVAELLTGQKVKQLTESDFDDIYQVILMNDSVVLTMLKSLPLSEVSTSENQSQQ